MTRIPAIEIIITRAEGPIWACVTKRFGGASCWKDADDWLATESRTAPKHGGYDKCDVFINFAEDDSGEPTSFYTRYDLVHWSRGFPCLADHVISEITFYAGRAHPAHMTQERYESFLAHVDTAKWQRLCDRFDIPGVAS